MVDFDALWSRFKDGLHRMALGRLQSATDAEDCVQETFARAIRYRDSYDESRPFGPWLRSILVNVVRARVARRSCQRFLTELEAEGLSTPDTTGLEVERREEARDRTQALERLARLVDQLPEADRQLVNLYYREGWNGPLIAEALKITEETVRQRLSRVRVRLRAAFGGPEA